MSKSDDGSQPLKNIVVFVIYSAVFILMFILLAKRQIFRMKLRYDKNFETGSVNLMSKFFIDSVEEKLAEATKARHPPQLLPTLDEKVTDLWPETKVRMRALAVVDETFINELELLGDDIAKTPEEDILEWYERIAKKFSTQNIR
ncbi:unnamed protein product [Oikopleura dioica]|uniref:Uncharacterized protein n=2 Tax=Oikopleura dioica TaxID=34765 RepID=E4Z5W1_OIKDI|nr:unnamed protein product [Oikopleura dioica]